MFFKPKQSVMFFCAFSILISWSGAAKEKEKYDITKMPKALYLTDPDAKDAKLEFSTNDCPDLKPGTDGAYGYLEMITAAGNRRTGSQEMRCASAAVQRLLENMGYKVQVIDYRFPYYYFSDQTFSLKEIKSGKAHPAHPYMYSPGTGDQPGQVISGKVVRPDDIKKGDLVYVSPGSLFGSKKRSLEFAKWKEKGAVGLVVDPKMFPYNTMGLPFAKSIHPASWHYGALPGLVVQDADKLAGKEVELKTLSKIYSGRGYVLAAITPGDFDDYILVSGHLDSWYTGTLDDGSGVAEVLRMAELMKDYKPKKTGIVFLAFDGEELGLFGSQVFCQWFGTEKVKAMLDMDMVSIKNNYLHKSPEKAKIMPKVFSTTPELRELAKEVYAPLHSTKLYLDVGLWYKLEGGLPTDYEWFYAAGVPGVFIYTPDKYYHTQFDNMTWMDAADLEAVAQANVELIKRLADMEIKRPADPLVLDFEFHRQNDGAVVFDLGLSKGKEERLKAKPVVLCYYEHGFEKKVELKPGQGGGYRGVYYPLYRGEYQFIASATVGNEGRKVVKSLKITDPVKEEPKEKEEKKKNRD